MNKIYIVGIGPGSYEHMTIQAVRTLERCDTIVGYPVYVDLVKPHFPEKKYRSTAMTQEVERCKMCFEEAKKGNNVAMICSGDAGVYGMAGLMHVNVYNGFYWKLADGCRKWKNGYAAGVSALGFRIYGLITMPIPLITRTTLSAFCARIQDALPTASL